MARVPFRSRLGIVELNMAVTSDDVAYCGKGFVDRKQMSKMTRRVYKEQRLRCEQRSWTIKRLLLQFKQQTTIS